MIDYITTNACSELEAAVKGCHNLNLSLQIKLPVAKGGNGDHYNRLLMKL